MIAAFSSIFAHQSRLGDNVIVDAESRALRFDVGDRTTFASSVHGLQAASIQQGTVTASLILRKIGSYPRQNSLALALREIAG